ncbi:MAG: M1 family metallopeptidase [Bacteroidota bacterium]
MKRPILLFLLIFGTCTWAQKQDKLDFKKAKIAIAPNPFFKAIQGEVRYVFDVEKPLDSFYLDAKDMNVSEVLLNEKPIRFTLTKNKLIIQKKLKPSAANSLQIQYDCKPKQAVYFVNWNGGNTGREEIWTQGQGKYSSHWVPSFDDMNEKVEFDLDVIFDSRYTVIANGKLMDKKQDQGVTIWSFDMTQPMSSYLLAFAIGKYEKKQGFSSSGVPFSLFYKEGDSLKSEPTYRYSKRIFDFLEEEIGVPYPWQDYKQVPVHDFLYAGMENTTATFFSNRYVIDSMAFADKNYVNVNAHELAHQWFGNFVTEESGEHHWLHEGFATYYAYLAEKELFGSDYFYWKLWDTAKALHSMSKEGNGEALTNPQAGSLTFYEKGAWALVILRDIVGDSAFRTGIQNYLNRFAYQNVRVQEFMWEMRKASGMKLAGFEEVWLQQSEFPMEQAKQLLALQNKDLSDYFQFTEKENLTTNFLKEVWSEKRSEPFKEQVVLDVRNQISDTLWSTLLERESTLVRQAFAQSTTKVNDTTKLLFKSFLKDFSYQTREAALYRLWVDFPLERKQILDQTVDYMRCEDASLKLLWYTLALATSEYREGEKLAFYGTLEAYTNADHHFEERLLAFQYLNNLAPFSNSVLRNLISGSMHHVWYFKKSCRKLLKDFAQEAKGKERIQALYASLSAEEQKFIDKTLAK